MKGARRMDLTERKKQILKRVVEDYIAAAEPVGSKALAEEIADVEIMLEQLKVIFRNRALVDRIRANKLVRLSDRITGEARE